MKKLICVLLSVLLFANCAVSALAVDIVSKNNDVSIDMQVAEQTRDILRYSVEPNKDMFEMNDVDFENLKLGVKIPTYETKISGITAVGSVSYYPIMDGNSWVATATAYFDNNVLKVQVSRAFVDEYKLNFEDNERIAIIFDIYGSSIVSEKKSAFAYAAREQNEELGTWKLQEIAQIKRCALNGVHDVSVMGYDNGNTLRSGTPNYQVTLPVPGVYQGVGTSTCWACCVLAVCRYYGIDTDLEEVYEMAMVSYGIGGGLTSARIAFEGYNLHPSSIQTFNWNLLMGNIANGWPIIAGCWAPLQDLNDEIPAHAIVIHGYYVYQNITNFIGQIVCMDPYSGNTVACNVSYVNRCTYQYPGTTNQYSIREYIYVAP